MNRTLNSLTSSQVTPSSTPSWLDRRELAFPVEQPSSTAAHSCFAPMHYESGYAYPLLVWLHGPSSNEDELPQVMPLISTRNHVAVAPRGTRHVDGVPGAYCWEDTPTGIIEANERVEACIAAAQKRFNVHPDRIFIAGHATGGTMAHRLGMEYPEQFAGAISLGGQVPRGSRLFKHLNRARKLPLLLSVSPEAEAYSTERVMGDLRFLHNAGLSLSLRLYPDGGDLTTVMFNDLDRWVMEQTCSPSVIAN